MLSKVSVFMNKRFVSMPIYSYKCEICGEEKDISVARYVDAVAPFCENAGCKGKKMKKILSKCSFILKGGGWAKTGYTKGK